VIALFLGVAIGIFSAVRQYSVFDYTFTSFSFLGFAMPTFWLALLLQDPVRRHLLKWGVRIFYTSGLKQPRQRDVVVSTGSSTSRCRVITLTIISFALYSRYMRASMLDVINTDYCTHCACEGPSGVAGDHAPVFRNALIPLTTVSALNFGAVLGGAIVTETVSGLDGFGFYFVNKLGQQDVYAVMAYLMVTAIIIIIANLIADVLYGFLDPRIRYD